MGWVYYDTESAARRVAEFAENLLQEKNHHCVDLDNHARLTISTLEKFLKNRGETTGLKKWEQELLVSAYRAARMPEKDWKFGLAGKEKIQLVKYWGMGNDNK